MVKTWAKRLYMAFIFLLLYLPIIVLVVLSFNKSKARVTWRGFTFQWYANLFDNSRIMDAFTTTLTLAFGSALAATIIGVVGAIGISAMKKRNYSIMLGATNIPMLNAEIVTALSLTLLFIRFIKFRFIYSILYKPCIFKAYRLLNVQTLCIFPCFCPYEPKQGKFLFSADYLIQQSCGSTLRFPCSVSVNVHCGTDISVSEKFLHIFRCCTV